MRIRLCSILFLLFLASPAVALKSGCPAEYSAEQCEQLKDDPDGDGTSGGDPGSGACPYYLCGNATGSAQSSYDWCEATQAWSDCPIYYCVYQPCIGTNCSPETITCSSCSSRQGNNAHISDCPRT